MKSFKPMHSALMIMLGTFSFIGTASALTLKTNVLGIYQEGTGSRVKIGHVVDATTNFNRLHAGGAYTVTCSDPAIMPSAGNRAVPANNIMGGLRLIVTIPREQPAYINLSGFHSLPRGSVVPCIYDWSAHATEGGYAVSAYGVTMQTGNGSGSEAGVRTFTIRVPSGTDPNENSTCIP